MTNIRRFALVVTVAVLALFAGIAISLAAQGARGICQHEDSTSCVWVGPVQGNGSGRVVVNGPDN